MYKLTISTGLAVMTDPLKPLPKEVVVYFHSRDEMDKYIDDEREATAKELATFYKALSVAERAEARLKLYEARLEFYNKTKKKIVDNYFPDSAA